MTDNTIWVAKKSPHSNGGAKKAFGDHESADAWLIDELFDEPEVEAFRRVEQSDPFPDYTYEVVQGVGEVAGTLSEVELAGEL